MGKIDIFYFSNYFILFFTKLCKIRCTYILDNRYCFQDLIIVYAITLYLLKNVLCTYGK